MPPKKPSARKQKNSAGAPPKPPDIPQAAEPSGPVKNIRTKNSNKTLAVSSHTQQAEPTNTKQAKKGSKVSPNPADTPHGDNPTTLPTQESLVSTKAPSKRGKNSKKDQPPEPDDVARARTQLIQAISSATNSISNTRPSQPLPPPLQTRRAAKAAAQARVNPVDKAQQPEAVQQPQRPQARPLPPGLRLSPDSDDGFDIPKRRAKVARALERYRAEHPPTEPTTPLPPTAQAQPVPSVFNPPPAPVIVHQKPSAGHPAPATALVSGPARSALVATQAVSKPALMQTERSPTADRAGVLSGTAVCSVPHKAASVVSPGGRHYSGLFPSAPSVSLSGPGVFPPNASRYSTRIRSCTPVVESNSDEAISDPQSCTERSGNDHRDDDQNPHAADEASSSPPPIQYSSDPHEDKIIRLCIRHGLDPKADYEKMARAYLAAKKKRRGEEADDQMSTDQEQEYEEDTAGSHGTGDSDGGGDGEGGGSGDNDDDDSGEDDDDRYGPERDPWLIDPDTNNTLAPCTYNFQTSSCSIRYYGPAPEFVGSNGEVERFTTYRWNKPGASMAFQRIAGGFKVPRAGVWQLADARREVDRQRAVHIAAGLIQPHNDDDDDSGSDYSSTQQELKTRGQPVDVDLERESDVASPVKPEGKGKGREVPVMPLKDKGKSRADPVVPISSAKLEDQGKQRGAAAGSSAGVGGRPSMDELAMCDALGVKFHRSVTDIGLLYGRRPDVILARLGLVPAPTRHTSIWNAFQTLFSLKAPEVPHDADWVAKCTRAYKQAMDGLTPEQKKAFEHAVFAELDGIAEDPERVRTPVARMKSAIDEARKMSSIERYTPDLVRLSVFIYTGSDPAARQMSCVVTPSNILKSALERHNIALQPLIDIAADLIRGEATLQQVEAAARHQEALGPGPADNIETVRRELHEFSAKEKLAYYRIIDEPKRALEKAERLPSKERGPMYRRICTTHILTEMNYFLPYGEQKRKTVPFGNWAVLATSWQITLFSWPDDVSIWPGCPLSMKGLTVKDWQKVSAPFIKDPRNAIRIESWTDEQKNFSPDSQEYHQIPLVLSASGDVLVNVFEGQSLIRRPRVRSAGTHANTAIALSDHDSDDDEIKQVQMDVGDTRATLLNGDGIKDFDDVEDFAEDIDSIVSTDNDNDNTVMVEHNGNVLYRIHSVTPDATPLLKKHVAERYNEDDMYELDRREREQQHQQARDIRPLPLRRAPNPSPLPARRHVHPPVNQLQSHPEAHVVKRRRQDDDETQDRQIKRKVVRIQPPPVEEPVQDHRRSELARLEQLRSMPAPESRRPRAPPLVFPPPAQLPGSRREGVSTEAFYKAMGGPPPSGRPLEPRPRPYQSSIPQPAQQDTTLSCRAPRPRIPAHYDSDAADDLSTGPNPLTHMAPSARFNQQRELRDGQAGPSNERFIPKIRGKRRDH